MSGDEAVAVTSEETPYHGVFLTIGGRNFKVRDTLPQWDVMKLAKGMKEDDMTALAAMYDFIRSFVLPEDWEELDSYLSTLDLARSDFDNAIGDCLAGLARRGKERPSPSSAGSTTEETPGSSRVVSLSRGTVQVQVQGPGLSEAATTSSTHSG